MGWFTNEEQKAEVNNQISNNVSVAGTVDVDSDKIVLLLSILVVINLIEFFCYVYIQHSKKIRRKYTGSQA